MALEMSLFIDRGRTRCDPDVFHSRDVTSHAKGSSGKRGHDKMVYNGWTCSANVQVMNFIAGGVRERTLISHQ